jgi:hypothetical protein
MIATSVANLAGLTLLLTFACRRDDPVYDSFEAPDLNGTWVTKRFLPGAAQIQSLIVREGNRALQIALKQGDQIPQEALNWSGPKSRRDQALLGRGGLILLVFIQPICADRFSRCSNTNRHRSMETELPDRKLHARSPSPGRPIRIRRVVRDKADRKEEGNPVSGW